MCASRRVEIKVDMNKFRAAMKKAIQGGAARLQTHMARELKITHEHSSKMTIPQLRKYGKLMEFGSSPLPSHPNCKCAPVTTEYPMGHPQLEVYDALLGHAPRPDHGKIADLSAEVVKNIQQAGTTFAAGAKAMSTAVKKTGITFREFGDAMTALDREFNSCFICEKIVPPRDRLTYFDPLTKTGHRICPACAEEIGKTKRDDEHVSRS